MIGVLTDFGAGGPYVGEMLAVLAREAPSRAAISLICDLPRFRPREAGYLVAAMIARQPAGSVFVAVVDPGVGTASRKPVWLEADGRIVVGPDNGLLDIVARRAAQARLYEILWRPRALSSSFHGRDLFAPVAAALAEGRVVNSRALRRQFRWSARCPEHLDRIVHVDDFGNCMTGRLASSLDRRRSLTVGGTSIAYARTFGDVAAGEAFWYANSLGLVEIAANRASAAERLALEVGDRLDVR